MKCQECNQQNGHEIWCAFSTEDINAVELTEKIWFAVLEDGTRSKFAMAPSATEESALRYAVTHPSAFGVVAGQVLGVEAAQ